MAKTQTSTIDAKLATDGTKRVRSAAAGSGHAGSGIRWLFRESQIQAELLNQYEVLGLAYLLLCWAREISGFSSGTIRSADLYSDSHFTIEFQMLTSGSFFICLMGIIQ